MNKNTIIGAIIGIVIGVGGTVGAMSLMNSNTGSMTMAEMNADLKGKTGDDFDRAFLANMIEHHQAAVDMAMLIEANAKHDELKQLGIDIMSAQSKEIDMMQTWQTDWGYKITPRSHQMDGMSH